jgi:hypothetical protein
VEAVSSMISEAAATEFLVLIFEAIRVTCTVESMRLLWKQFRRWFLRRQRLSFQYWFLRPQGLLALSNQCVTLGSSLIDHF